MLLLSLRLFNSKTTYNKILKQRFNAIVIYKFIKPSNLINYNLFKLFINEQRSIFSLHSNIIETRDIFYQKYANDEDKDWVGSFVKATIKKYINKED